MSVRPLRPPRLCGSDLGLFSWRGAEPGELARWLAMLPEAELPMAGWYVASCAAELGGGNAIVELLLLEA